MAAECQLEIVDSAYFINVYMKAKKIMNFVPLHTTAFLSHFGLWCNTHLPAFN